MTAPRLRPYQLDAQRRIYEAWLSSRNVLAVLPTGAGKTVLFSEILRAYGGESIAIAHRQELVGQISLALARNGVQHKLIAAESTRRTICQLHAGELGRVYVNPTARVAVAGVDTLIKRDPADPYFQRVGLWVGDEWHHCQEGNKWGKAVALFPNAYGLGVTATPARADGKGLGRGQGGVMDALIEGPGMRPMINAGYLTPYRVFCPPSDVDYSAVEVSGTTGDYKPDQLRGAVHKSTRIVGDVVQHYLRIASGKRGVTFAVDVAAATELAAAFRAAGVPAEVVSAKTPDLLRAQILRRFRAGDLLQLVNVDLFGEGFDLPAIECVSFVRKTQSWPLYVQQFGRALRLMLPEEHRARWDDYTEEQRRAIIAGSDKPCGVIIDHVGNVLQHGLPDKVQVHTLDARERRSQSRHDGEIPLRVCLECTQPYERALSVCPWCGAVAPEPAGRGSPELVDGDLFELDPAALAVLRGEADRVMSAPRIPQGLDHNAAMGLRKRHAERQDAQRDLRALMADWGGWQAAQGREPAEAMRRFYFAFGIDCATAQTLGAREAADLAETIRATLGVMTNA